MEFEFDPAKSDANKTKHGLDFHEAQSLWSDVDAIEVPAQSATELRRLLVAKRDNKDWTAVFTERSGRIRIISARRSRTSEIVLYEQNDSGES